MPGQINSIEKNFIKISIKNSIVDHIGKVIIPIIDIQLRIFSSTSRNVKKYSAVSIIPYFSI